MMRHDTNDVLPVLGEEIERYRVIAEVAQGGMAAVYIVHRKAAGFDKLFAMKVMLPQLRDDPQYTAMFLDEAQIGSKVQHPNVVQIFAVGDRHGSPFMVMELLRGKSLSHILKARAKGRVFLSRGLLFWILARVADGLHAAHEAVGHDNKPLNIIHRDVSFQNIHIGYDGQVKIVDFGIADAEGREARTRTGEVMGKMQFMAPEQFNREHPVDRRADIWALGVVAWRALTGTRLFRGATDAETMWNVVHGEVPDIADTSKEPLSPEVAHLIMSCLDRDPSKRPASSAKISEVFQRAAQADNGSTDELALFMENAFCDDKRLEEAALTQATNNPHTVAGNTELRGILAFTPPEGSQPIDTPTPAIEMEPHRKGTPWLALTAGGVSLVAIAAVAWIFLGNQASQESSISEGKTPTAALTESKTEQATTIPETPVALETKAVQQEVRIRLGAAVRMALVDGTRHDERPLLLLLSKEDKVKVTVLTADSEKVWTVGVEDDGRMLEMPTVAKPTTEEPALVETVPAKVEAPVAALKATPPTKTVKKKAGTKKAGTKKAGTKKSGTKKSGTKKTNKKKQDKKSGGGLIEVPL